MYYLCEPIGEQEYRIHHMPCGALFWNQYHLGCGRKPSEDCIIDAIVSAVPEISYSGRWYLSLFTFRISSTEIEDAVVASVCGCMHMSRCTVRRLRHIKVKTKGTPLWCTRRLKVFDYNHCYLFSRYVN